MAQQPPPRVFSPVQSSPSPANAGAFLPPNKRQRLSPNPSSPYALTPNPQSPNFSNVALPAAASVATPVNGSPVMPPPPPTTTTGAMGPPPSRPAADKATDLNELGDVIASSGIDIRDEEAAMYQSYLSNDKPAAASFGSQATVSFNSASSGGSAPGGYPTTTTSEGYSVSLPVQAGAGAFYGTGPLSQPAVPSKTPEEIAAESWRRKARALNEKRQQHLYSPFLYSNTVRHKIGRRAFENGVRVPMEGLYDPIPEKIPANRPVNSQSIVGSDGTTVSVVKGPSLIDETAPLADILALISLAAEERIKTILEDAAEIARGRRVGSHGIVPAEWSDLAVGPGGETSGAPVTSAPATGSAGVSSSAGNRQGWESAVSPKSNPLKRPHSSSNKLPDGTPKPTVSFQNELARALRNMSQKERQQEEARLARRAKRAADAAASGGTDASRGGVGSTPGTPSVGGGGSSLLGERAPEVKMTKKEREKLAKAGESEASQHAAANVMANISLGGSGGGGLFGKKKGAYSWMTKDKPSATSSAFPSRLNTSFGSGSAGSTADSTAAYLGPGGRRFGEWREDREKGAGIQMRDLISALEADGRDRKTLAWAYTRLDTKD